MYTVYSASEWEREIDWNNNSQLNNRQQYTILLYAIFNSPEKREVNVGIKQATDSFILPLPVASHSCRMAPHQFQHHDGCSSVQVHLVVCQPSYSWDTSSIHVNSYRSAQHWHGIQAILITVVKSADNLKTWQMSLKAFVCLLCCLHSSSSTSAVLTLGIKAPYSLDSLSVAMCQSTVAICCVEGTGL